MKQNLIFFSDYGKGYAWNKPYLVIYKGDSVKWTWKAPSGITCVSYQVIQVKDPYSFVPIGFNSGAATPTGSFEFQFNQAGTFHYWSGYVESSEQITFRGIIVVKDSVDKDFELSVLTNIFKGNFKKFFNFIYFDFLILTSS